MFIHFALSKHKSDPFLQAGSVIDLILKHRKLKFTVNTEFIPVFQPHIHRALIAGSRFKDNEVINIPLEAFKSDGAGASADLSSVRSIDPEYDIYFLPENVKMICFIKISLKKLLKSNHSNEYGKFGLVFTDEYLRRKGIREVYYYEENNLFTDPLILKWNREFAYKPTTPANTSKKKELTNRILSYRKPYILFKSFRDSRIMVIRGNDMDIRDAYERYPIGYNFSAENEWRIVSADDDFLEFTETDLRCVIVPDAKIKEVMEEYFSVEWTTSPEVMAWGIYNVR